VIGVTWFAAGASGYVGASFGYIIGFIVCSGVCGRMAERGADRSVLTSIPAMLVGEVAIYAIGVSWLGIDLHVGVSKAIALGLTPFILGDLIKAAIVATALPSAWKLLGSRR
jgi:biotin transport system substrate-specific component